MSETQGTVEFDRTASVRRGHPFWMFALAFLVIGLDQWSKWWIRFNLYPDEEMPLWPGMVHLSHVWNKGAAWGLFQGQRWPLILVSCIIVGAIIYSTGRIVARGRLVTAAAGLVLGGAVGNLIDRIYAGHVTDMIDLDTPISLLRNFPVFNLADSALSVGVVLLAVHFFLAPEPSA